MMISQKMNALMNQQIGHEMGASLQYIAIAGHFAGESLNVFSAHFLKQAEEEREHAMKFVHYILETGGKVEIPAIPAPKATFKNAEEAVALSLNWEQTVTAQIHHLMTLAVKESDFASQGMLQWFVTEQIEEVSSMENLLRLVQRAGEKNLFFVEGALARANAAK
jgi:ferritin